MLHSRADSVNYYADALKIYTGTRQRRQDVEFVSFGHFGHNYIYQKEHFDYWAPIVRFIRERSLCLLPLQHHADLADPEDYSEEPGHDQ